MRTGIRRRIAADEGISLVEMLVTVMIIGVALLALLNSAVTSLAVTHADEVTTRASALANDVLENAQAVPWLDLGHFAADFLPAAPPSDAVIVAAVSPGGVSCAGSPAPTGCRTPQRAETLTRDGTTYTVVRSVTWTDDPATSSPRDSKRIRVEVRWETAAGQLRTETMESLRAPTRTEQAGSEFVLRQISAAPSIVYLDDDGRIRTPSPGPAVYDRPPVELTAVTSQRSSTFVQVMYQDREGNDRPTDLPSPDMVRSRATIGAAEQFRNGDTTFTFEARRGSETVRGTTIVRFLHDLEVRTVTSTPETWCLPADQSAVAPSVTFTIPVQGAVAEDEVIVTMDDDETAATPAASDESGTTFVHTVPAGHYTASFEISIAVRRLADQALAGPVVHTFTVDRPVSC